MALTFFPSQNVILIFFLYDTKKLIFFFLEVQSCMKAPTSRKKKMSLFLKAPPHHLQSPRYVQMLLNKGRGRWREGDERGDNGHHMTRSHVHPRALVIIKNVRTYIFCGPLMLGAFGPFMRYFAATQKGTKRAKNQLKSCMVR